MEKKIEAYGEVKNLRKLSFNLGTYFNPKVLNFPLSYETWFIILFGI